MSDKRIRTGNISGTGIAIGHQAKVTVRTTPASADTRRFAAPTPAPGDAPAGAVVTRPSLRKLLRLVIIGDTDLEAFCLDYFPDVHNRFSDGMDRVGKENLLLQHVQISVLLERLNEAYSESITAHQHVLRYE